MKTYLLPREGTFFKANLHCHTTCSDGHWTPEQVKAEYMAQGYSVVAYTDHDVMVPHPELRDAQFLPLAGFEAEVNEEGSGTWAQNKCCHVCFIALEEDNVTMPFWHRERYLFGNAPAYLDRVKFREDEPDYLREYSPAGISDMMHRGRDRGFFVTYNHPAWSLEDWRDYTAYDGMHAMEMVNYACAAWGYDEYNPRVYDDMLRAGKRIFCIDADDNHNRGGSAFGSFGGFTMIKAPALEYRAVTRALEAGDFYASQGPLIHELYIEDGAVHITCSPAVSIVCTYDLRRTDIAIARETPLTEAVLPLAEDARYFRLTVTDACGRHANTNAYFADTLPRKD